MSLTTRLRAAFAGGTAFRSSPRMRFVQIGCALAAALVLGGVLGTPDAEHPTAHEAPAAPDAAPAPPPTGRGTVAPVRPAPRVDPVDAWIDQASDVLERHGYSTQQIDRHAIRTIIVNESGGNPTATNTWDSNAAAGTPSRGLMQTIDPTFHSYALPGHRDILDPVDNIIAGTRYSIDRYGSVSAVPGVSGVRAGGVYQGY